MFMLNPFHPCAKPYMALLLSHVELEKIPEFAIVGLHDALLGK
jgi:hypothetical protein